MVMAVTQVISTTQHRPFYPRMPVFFCKTRVSIFSTANRPQSRLCCRSSYTHNTYSNDSSRHWDWNRWTTHISEILQAEIRLSSQDAIEKEDYQKATKLKRAIAEATSSKDSVAEIMAQLKNAIDEERYHDASRLCRDTGSGLVGWWVGCSKDSDDPFGRIIHISPGMGRFVAKVYSPRQLVTASPGTPIFEIYVVKNADDTYQMQVVYLQRIKGNSMSNPPSLPVKSPAKAEVESSSSLEVQDQEEKDNERNDEKNSNIEGATEEGIKSLIINFIKEKIPGLKVKVMNIKVEKEGAEDNDSIKQLRQEDSNETSSTENPEEEVNNLDEPDRVTLEGDRDASEEEKYLDMELFIGGVADNNEETPVVMDEFMRLPAEIEDIERDFFVFHNPRRNLDYNSREQIVPIIKVRAQAGQRISELIIPSDVGKAFWSSDKVSSEVSKSVREILNLAVSQARRRSRLSEHTSFSRIITSSRGDSDPFDGLYVGVLGPYGGELGLYGTQVVQLKRKFGHWNDVDRENKPSDMELFEYVEVVNVSGDRRVPAGQVLFRAKIGRAGNLNTDGRMYPDELGVVANYKGQVRIADFGFRNPRWVDGELLQLNGKGTGLFMKGADIGFHFVVPGQSFLMLFNRLKLPE